MECVHLRGNGCPLSAGIWVSHDIAHYYGDDMTSSTWSFTTEDSSSGCSTGILNPLFLLLLAPLGLLLGKSR